MPATSLRDSAPMLACQWLCLVETLSTPAVPKAAGYEGEEHSQLMLTSSEILAGAHGSGAKPTEVEHKEEAPKENRGTSLVNSSSKKHTTSGTPGRHSAIMEPRPCSTKQYRKAATGFRRGQALRKRVVLTATATRRGNFSRKALH